MVILDFETFKYNWILCWLDTDTRKTHFIIDDKEKLQKFYDYYKYEIMVGYNIQHFDKYILQGILCDFDPYDITQWIIRDEKQGWMYSNLFNKFPINSFDTMVKDKSLKHCEASLGLRIVESSVPFDIDRPLTKNELLETIEYCKYDVMSTFEVFLEDGFFLSPQDEFSTSIGVINEFGFPLSYISKTKAQLGCAILGGVKKKFNDEFDIFTPNNVILGKYEYVRDWFLDKENHWYTKTINGRVSDVKNEFVTNVGGVSHVFAWGGVHASVKKYHGDGCYLMLDFASLYPNIMINYDLVSRAVYNKQKYVDLLNRRLELKAQHDSREKSYKIALNGSYGQMGFENSPLYDKRNANNVCIHGQLIILDLIEKVEPYCEIINTNTDGVLIKLNDRSMIPKIRKIADDVAERVNIEIDIDEYSKVFIKDVNNYIAIEPSGKYKAKGSYVKILTPFEQSMEIVNRAIRERLVNGVKVEDTVMSSNNLMDFQIIGKAGGKYESSVHNPTFRITQVNDPKTGKSKKVQVWNGDGILNQKVNRVFASNKNDGGIYKKHKQKSGLDKIGMTPEDCFIINDDIRGIPIPKNLNKQWYIDLANKRVGEFLGK